MRACVSQPRHFPQGSEAPSVLMEGLGVEMLDDDGRVLLRLFVELHNGRYQFQLESEYAEDESGARLENVKVDDDGQCVSGVIEIPAPSSPVDLLRP